MSRVMASFVLFYCTNNNKNTKSLILEVYNKPSVMRSNWLFQNGNQHIISELWKCQSFTSADGRPDYFWIHMQFPVFGFIVTDNMFPECVWMCAWSNDNALLQKGKCCWCIHDIVLLCPVQQDLFDCHQLFQKVCFCPSTVLWCLSINS